MRLSLMPRKGTFFVLFTQHAENALEAAQALEKLVTDFTRVEDKVRDIHAIEHYGDKLTHQIIQDHGGEIHVASRVGRGTTFTLSVPVA